MKSTGITRKVDELGRVVIPKELRDNLGIEEKTPMEILVEGEDIILRKYSGGGCVFCGEMNENKEFFGKKICKECHASIADLIKR